MKNLKKLKRKYEELGKEIERLEKNKGRWRAEKNEKYYYVDHFGDVNFMGEANDYFDDYRFKTRNYFKTEKEAQNYLDNIKTYYELMDLAEELNGDEKINLEDERQAKYFIAYSFCENNLVDSHSYKYKRIGNIYCLDEDFLEKAKERIGEERLIKLFKGGVNR